MLAKRIFSRNPFDKFRGHARAYTWPRVRNGRLMLPNAQLNLIINVSILLAELRLVLAKCVLRLYLSVSTLQIATDARPPALNN